MRLIERLDQIISDFHLLKHTYYQKWSKGELSLENLKKYSSQYYKQVESFPRFISRVHTNCPEIKARKVLLENLIDEEQGTDHPTLWMQFANHFGHDQRSVKADKALPHTQAMVDKFYELADRDWQAGLCALYAYESQVPSVSASKIDGLKQFYGIDDPSTLAFFTAHQVYDVEHAQQVAKLIESYADPIVAEKATKEAAEVLWNFLDGICEAEGIAC